MAVLSTETEGEPSRVVASDKRGWQSRLMKAVPMLVVARMAAAVLRDVTLTTGFRGGWRCDTRE